MTLPDQSDSLVQQLVELARGKGYAIDFVVYRGAHLDEYVTGTRITAPDFDLRGFFARGLREVGKWEPNDDAS